MTEADKKSFLADVNKTDTSNLSLQTRLEKQLGVVDLLSKGATDNQTAAANRKVIALTQGIDPRSLTESQRDRVVLARDKEVDRLIKLEDEAKREREVDREIRKCLNAILDKLARTAEKGGTAAVNITLKDETSAGVNCNCINSSSSRMDIVI